MWNPSKCVYYECNKAHKIDEYSNVKYRSCKKHCKLVLACEDEILNTTETSLDNKTVTCEKNSLIHTISLVIIYLLLLLVISVSFYYTRHWVKKEYALLNLI